MRDMRVDRRANGYQRDDTGDGTADDRCVDSGVTQEYEYRTDDRCDGCDFRSLHCGAVNL